MPNCTKLQNTINEQFFCLLSTMAFLLMLEIKNSLTASLNNFKWY